VVAIHQPDSILDRMDEWNTSHHTSSGLVERVRLSKHTAQTAEQATLDFVGQWVPAGRSPMSGNSICQDRRFMARQMPGLENYFHYRNLDVSTIKILASRWAPSVNCSTTGNIFSKTSVDHGEHRRRLLWNTIAKYRKIQKISDEGTYRVDCRSAARFSNFCLYRSIGG